ncbi:tRNA 2-thiouridine(34) synthase MnmA [candidate division KSB1 bacterium]|nr:tRNA 2-thiouridine(34) synthase MnmA [candidate division KSB1 bacterium]
MSANRQKVAIAMSGGIDSSVAAALLKEQGYDVVGLTMHLWNFDSVGGNVHHETSCCSIDNIHDARHVCDQIGIPHYTVDVRREFEQHVIGNFVSEYLSGRTPNPCVLCNSMMKWSVLMQKADQLGFGLISTGHYAQIIFDDKKQRFHLVKGIDLQKDQSYALWALTQDQLARTLLPLGIYTKPQVRELAERFGLKTFQKSESQEICFIPDNNYRRFIQERAPEKIADLKNGEIVDTDGNVLGYHNGYPYFTIGQRRKLGVAVGRPIYVVDIDVQRNRIVVGDQDDLKRHTLFADRVNWVSIAQPEVPFEAIVRIRYNDKGKPASIKLISENIVRVEFHEPVQAVTPGQSAVFFDDEQVLGGGIITSDHIA